MKIFRRSSKHSKQNSVNMNPSSQSVIVNDGNRADILDDSGNLDQLSLAELVKKNRHLTEQNNHLNTYILQLVKENEKLQDRLNDMKVTLAENKQLMRDYMESQNNIAAQQ